LIIIYHGGYGGTIYGVDNVMVDINALTNNDIGTKLVTVDLVGCYANMGVSNFINNTNIPDVRTYNPNDEVILFNQTNDVLNNRIPESIGTGADTSGQPNALPMPDLIYFGSKTENPTPPNNYPGDQNEYKKNE
jgi:hypothetical protein